MAKTIARIVVVLTTVLSVMLIPGPDAKAVWQCRAWREWPIYAYATCDYGLGGVRVVADCWYPSGGLTLRYRGPWVSAGQVSRSICNGGSYVVRADYETF